MGKLSPYDRKEWNRKHSTSKEMRWLNKGIDAAFKGAGKAGKSVAKASRKATKSALRHSTTKGAQPTAKAEPVKIPMSLVVVSLAIGILAFLLASINCSLVLSLFGGIVAFWIAFSICGIIYGTAKGIKDGYDLAEAEKKKETEWAATPHYEPNPDWMGDMSLINNRQNAQLVAPQLVKQIRESGKILESTTEPETFFTRYDFCVGRLKLLKECQNYGVFSENTNEALRQMLTLSYRDDVVGQMIQRTQAKYRTKIESLKTTKAKKNWADKFHLAFEPYLSCMSDAQKSMLGEASAELYSLADISGDAEKETT